MPGIIQTSGFELPIDEVKAMAKSDAPNLSDDAHVSISGSGSSGPTFALEHLCFEYPLSSFYE